MYPMPNLLLIAIKSAWRNFIKNFSFNVLNLAGLALTFATLILIYSYLFHEHSFESFHHKRDRIFRPTYRTSSGDFSVQWARIPIDYINELPEEIPGVKRLVRFQNQEQKYLRVGDKRFKPKHAYITDPHVFQVFDFPFLAGDPSTALTEPFSVVISKSEALKIFSQTDVIGNELSITGDWSPKEKTYTITGIIDDLPSNTHLPVEMLFSFADKKERAGWAYVYIELEENVSIFEVESKMPEFIKRYRSDPAGPTVEIFFQALGDIHLYSHLAREIQPNGQRIYLKIFFWFGLFIWIISIVNFSNINLAQTLARGKEIGVRKILGAVRSQIAWQMLGETSFYTLIALFFGVTLAYSALPLLQSITGIKGLPPLPHLMLFLVLAGIITSLITAFFPIFYISSIRIIPALKHGTNLNLNLHNQKINFRKGLIAIQLTAALLLVSGTLITYTQFQFIRKKNLGFSKEQILSIPSVPDAVVKDYPIFRNVIKGLPGVTAVSACMQVPSDEIRDTGPVLIKGQSQDINQAPQIDIQIIDPEFTTMMQLKFLAGKPLDSFTEIPVVPEFSADLTPANYLSQAPRKYLINETALHQLGWDNPEEAIGKEINFSIGGFNLDYGPIVGVVEDYHQESLRNKIDPLVMVVEPLWLQTFLIKIAPDQIDATLAQIEKKWNQLFPYSIEFHFLD